MNLSPEQIARITARVGREVEAFLRNGVVEQHYSAESLAELLEVTERTVWSYVDLYDSTAGREGLGPVVKLSHKTVRIPASAVRRLLASKTVNAAALVGADRREEAPA